MLRTIIPFICASTLASGCDQLAVKTRVHSVAPVYAFLDTSASAAVTPVERCTELRRPLRRALKRAASAQVRLVVWRTGSAAAPEPVEVLSTLSPALPRRMKHDERMRAHAIFVDEVEERCRAKIGGPVDTSPVLRGLRRLVDQAGADLTSLPPQTTSVSTSIWVFSDLRDSDDADLGARFKQLARRRRNRKAGPLPDVAPLTLDVNEINIEVCGTSQLAPGHHLSGLRSELVLQAWKPVLGDAVIRPICERDDVGNDARKESNR